MPANPKYLTHNKTQRFAKVSAAILGGFMVSASSMLALAVWSDNPKNVFHTYAYGLILLWCTLMLIAFLFHNGWRCWAWYGGITVLFGILYMSHAFIVS